MEKARQAEVTLEDLADRNPGVKEDVDDVIFEVEIEVTDEDLKAGGKTAIEIAREVAIGVIVSVVLIYLTPHLPFL